MIAGGAPGGGVKSVSSSSVLSSKLSKVSIVGAGIRGGGGISLSWLLERNDVSGVEMSISSGRGGGNGGLGTTLNWAFLESSSSGLLVTAGSCEGTPSSSSSSEES